MGDKMRFLLDYYQYIDDIELLSSEDDNKMYDKFKKHSKNGHLVLSEGLIKTHPLNKSVSIINKRFPTLKVEVEKDGEIYIEGEMQELKNYLPLFNNLGYFISLYTLNGSDWLNKYSDNTKPLALYLEPKYDIKIDNIPEFLYHTSPSRFKDKIQKIGFIPKTGNKLSKHPDRIYLIDDLNIASSFGRAEYNTDYCIYQIKGNCVSSLYRDINLPEGGFYTNDNISPKCFKLIKEIKGK